MNGNMDSHLVTEIHVRGFCSPSTKPKSGPRLVRHSPHGWVHSGLRSQACYTLSITLVLSFGTGPDLVFLFSGDHVLIRGDHMNRICTIQSMTILEVKTYCLSLCMITLNSGCFNL